ncbi:glycosyltransferase [Yersinia hibernica]|uniref:Glycosyl transferase family 1 n=1 Tax=Yersinia enterocolitica LC20 TaxID=1443113 RepID=A0A7U5PGL6_YEREN|nr:glycosyltransferase [Yersinia hibernica]ATX62804.1 glycosyl transferase family 1 [Yersinia hibernica]
MRIIIDMQGLQASNANRGIGRYILGLVSELVKTRGDNEVYLVLNNSLPEHMKFIKNHFSQLMPLKNIYVWESLRPSIDLSIESYKKIVEELREAYILSLSPDVLLITSLFEGLNDSAVTSISNFTHKIPTAVILYDLIPLIHKDIYLKDELVNHWYSDKIISLKNSDLLLAISDSSKKEAVDYLGFREGQVLNISTACDSKFVPCTINEKQREYLEKKYNILGSFILYTGGIDHRKNIEGLIRAFSLLPFDIRKGYQLAIVCSIQPFDLERLTKLARVHGLSKNELVITGFVPEKDLVTLYNACDFFVFPSWHEGFGLPVLEAMACGRAVIGGNLSSIPEVIGRKDALFDPYDDMAIAAGLQKLITNPVYRCELEKHGLEQAKKFSWALSSDRTWKAIEYLFESRKSDDFSKISTSQVPKKRLAYLSPLPKANSGISNYSAELIPELSKYYEIIIINAQKEDITDPWIINNCEINDINWFRENTECYDRVLYHFGNSEFHGHMFSLLSEIPGIVVLHDFFLSGIISHLDVVTDISPYIWPRELLRSHGWAAVNERYKALDTADVVYKYPCNLSLLQESLGIIVHSDYSRRLAMDFYGDNVADDWALIPLLRVAPDKIKRKSAREYFGFDDDDFIVCSFGLLGPTKLNHCLLSAWLSSPMSMNPKCKLIFVGENNSSEYGCELISKIKKHKLKNIRITGWIENEVYNKWLSTADIAVQLRTLSRGETSAAVLDCMNYGVATIVNANGSTADLPENVVLKLDDDFTEGQLSRALEELYYDEIKRSTLSSSALEYVHLNNDPEKCAALYSEAIEKFHDNYKDISFNLIDEISQLNDFKVKKDFSDIATILAKNFPPIPRNKQLFIDVSELVQCDAKSGIQRVVKELLQKLLFNPPKGYSVEPVYATTTSDGYYYARKFTCEFLDIPFDWIKDQKIDAWAGDIFLGLDLQPFVIPAQKEYLADCSRRGVSVYIVAYDLLPILHPEFFVDGALDIYSNWFETITTFDGVICISKTVACEFKKLAVDYIDNTNYSINWFHLGANLNPQLASTGMPKNADILLDKFRMRKTFLMVSTLEPRKRHAQVVAAFEQLWMRNIDVNLVIVGKQGWMVESLVSELHSHPELNKRLFWLEGISDEYLDNVYKECDCLISASQGEGFGLPLIEAAQNQLPIIARDIPVFREVAGDNALYFSGLEPEDLAIVIQDWIELYDVNKIPNSSKIKWQTWEHSAQQLLDVLLTENEKLLNK